MLNIKVNTIPHKNQSYDTCDDYWKRGKIYEYRISKLGDEYSELAVLVHALVESFLAKKLGISWREITDFDLEWEDHKGSCLADEPGFCPDAPYYYPHKLATDIERSIIEGFGMKWKKHEKLINNLKWQKKLKKNQQ